MNKTRLGMEFKQSRAYLHDSKLLLQVTWYDFKIGQYHEVLICSGSKGDRAAIA